jgi:transposase-like protein
MKFSITALLSKEQSEAWILAHFHPDGLKCPTCGTSVQRAAVFRNTKRSQLTVYRCRVCGKTYNLYTGTVFQSRHLTPQQVVLFLRGVLKNESSSILALELQLNYITVLQLRRALEAQMPPIEQIDDEAS